jgi:hypothetical protein
MSVPPANWDRLIEWDKRFLRLYAAGIGFVLALSTVLGIISVLELFGSNTVKYMLQVGAACIAVIGNVVPARQAWAQFERVSSSTMYKRLQEGPPQPDQKMLEFLEQMYFKLLARTGLP